ncbi:MAG: 8-oxo-dGTP diphosphatase [Patescibacteria group bacterium]
MEGKIKKPLTLCLVHQENKILLGMKKRGFGAGRWNGFGGKLQEEESIEAAAKREMLEEAGLDVRDLELVGIMEFDAPHFEKILEVHVFRAGDFEGEPIESEEMLPQWFETNQLPFDSMWPDDIHWMPLFLAGKKWRGRFFFDEKTNEIVEMEISEVDSL